MAMAQFAYLVPLLLLLPQILSNYIALPTVIIELPAIGWGRTDKNGSTAKMK